MYQILYLQNPKIFQWKLKHYKSYILGTLRFPLGVPNAFRTPAQLLESGGVMMDEILGLIGVDLDKLFNEMLGTVTFGQIKAHGISYYDIINTLSS